MADGQIDPTYLSGDALEDWYLRSPADVERERQQAAAQKYADFFGDQTNEDVQQAGALGPSSAASGFQRSRDVSELWEATPENGAQPTTLYPISTSRVGDVGFPLPHTSPKDQCIQQCTPLLERPQRPGSDRNQWDFHKPERLHGRSSAIESKLDSHSPTFAFHAVVDVDSQAAP